MEIVVMSGTKAVAGLAVTVEHQRLRKLLNGSNVVKFTDDNFTSARRN